MLKQRWTIYKMRLLFIVLTLVMIFPFDAIIDRMGFNMYCAFICLFYLPFVFLDSYKMAGYDKKAYTKTKSYEYKGFLLGVLSEAPAIIALLIAIIMTGGAVHSVPTSADLAYVLLMFPFMGFIGLPVYMSIYYYIPLLIIPIVAGVGYMLGYREYELVENFLSKVVYADDKKKK